MTCTTDEPHLVACENPSVVDTSWPLHRGQLGITASELPQFRHELVTRSETEPARSCRLNSAWASHHGSRRNVGPTILNRLIGRPTAAGRKADHAEHLPSADRQEGMNSEAWRNATTVSSMNGVSHFRRSQLPSLINAGGYAALLFP